MGMDSVHTVLIPGAGCTAQVFDTIVPEIWAQGSVTIADTRRDASIGGMAERLLATAPDRFAVAGFSMGGFVASEVVWRAPDRVAALAVMSTGSRPDTPEEAARRRKHQTLAREGRLDELTEAVFPALVGPAMAPFWSRLLLELGAEVFATQIDAILARPDYRPMLAMTACPAAVIHGAADRMVPMERAEELAACIPGATLTIVEDAGHLALRERPAAVAAALSSLLERARACM